MSKISSEDSFMEIMKLSPEALKQNITQGKKTLLQFRFQRKQEPVKPHEVKNMRRKIARLKTALGRKNTEAHQER